MKKLINQILNHKELAALPSLLEGGGLPALVSGLSAVHRANLAAALCGTMDRPLFVICPDDTAAENFARDLRSMLQRPAGCLGLREYCFLPTEAVSRRTEQKRLEVFSSLLESGQKGENSVTVASISALLQRTIPKDLLQRAAFTISSAETYAIEDLEEALIRCGYERTEQVEGPGQFARRGGILDLFSPAEEQPVRMEFWGDEIDSMGYFDISSQRRDETVTQCRILPAAEALPTLTPGGTETLCRKMEELADRYQKRRGSTSAGKIAATLRQDAEKLRTQLVMQDLDRWLPLLYPAATGFDYIPEDAIVFVDQPTRCSEMAKEYRKQLGDDLRSLQKDGRCAFSRRTRSGRSWSVSRSMRETRSPSAEETSSRRRS